MRVIAVWYFKLVAGAPLILQYFIRIPFLKFDTFLAEAYHLKP